LMSDRLRIKGDYLMMRTGLAGSSIYSKLSC